jgi:hypothetical protein
MRALAGLALILSAVPLAAEPLLDRYAAVAVGTFSSAAQHRTDPAYDSVDARVVRIWPERTDGLWLYQEQTIVAGRGAQQPPRPYFQRVGWVRAQADGTLRRDNFSLVRPDRFVGLGSPGYAGPALTPADLGQTGCHNIIESPGHGLFAARTEGCVNNWRGATIMRSVSVASPDRWVNWDRGFDAAGKRLWGPADGGYVFDRTR